MKSSTLLSAALLAALAAIHPLSPFAYDLPDPKITPGAINQGKGLHICFRVAAGYLIPHDELLDWVATNINIADATSWTGGGGYSFPTLSAALKTHLQQYRLATDRP